MAEIIVTGLLLALILATVTARAGGVLSEPTNRQTLAGERTVKAGSHVGARPLGSLSTSPKVLRATPDRGLVQSGLTRASPRMPGCDRPCWRKRYEGERKQRRQAEDRIEVLSAKLKQHQSDRVEYALRLAAAAFGVPYRELRAVARCESGLRAWARNPSGSSGLMQFMPGTWAHNRVGKHGFSVFDPIAAALGAAAHVSLNGWDAWDCQP